MMDDVDRAYLESWLPEGAVVVGMVSAVTYMAADADGALRWAVHCDMDAPVTTTLGLLEMAKLDVIARSDTGLPLRYDHGSDD